MHRSEFKLVIIFFLLISFLLTFLGILSIAMSDILSYSLIVFGIYIVYAQAIEQKGLPVFLGSIVFLLGVYFLISENFALNLDEGISIPIILIFAGSGLLVLHIVVSTRIVFLIISLVCLSTGITFFIINSRLNMKSFLFSMLPVLNYLWPTIIILAFLIFPLRKK